MKHQRYSRMHYFTKSIKYEIGRKWDKCRKFFVFCHMFCEIIRKILRNAKNDKCIVCFWIVWISHKMIKWNISCARSRNIYLYQLLHHPSRTLFSAMYVSVYPVELIAILVDKRGRTPHFQGCGSLYMWHLTLQLSTPSCHPNALYSPFSKQKMVFANAWQFTVLETFLKWPWHWMCLLVMLCMKKILNGKKNRTFFRK